MDICFFASNPIFFFNRDEVGRPLPAGRQGCIGHFSPQTRINMDVQSSGIIAYIPIIIQMPRVIQVLPGLFPRAIQDQKVWSCKHQHLHRDPFADPTPDLLRLATRYKYPLSPFLF